MEKNPRAEMMDFEKIGDRLRDLRKQKGITQQHTAADSSRFEYWKKSISEIRKGDSACTIR